MNKCIIYLTVEVSTPLVHKLSRESYYANKRTYFGEKVLSPFCDKNGSLPQEQYFQPVYHYGCYQNIVHLKK